MECPYCKKDVGELPWECAESCTDTDSMSSAEQVAENYLCECPHCGKNFEWRRVYTYDHSEMKRVEDESWTRVGCCKTEGSE